MTGAHRYLAILAAFAALLMSSSPGLAAAVTAIPEPTDLTLIGIAFAGLVAGRYIARRGKPD